MDLCKDPIKIIYLDRNLKPSHVSLFVGLCAGDMITEIQTISNRLNNNKPIESKKLKAFYGTEWKQKLGFDIGTISNTDKNTLSNTNTDMKTGGKLETDSAPVPTGPSPNFTPLK